MATTLQINSTFSVKGDYYETGQLAPGIERLAKVFSVMFTNGTGSNQATVLYAESFTAGQAHNLQALTDFLGQSRNLAKISLIAFINNDTTNTLTMTGSFCQQLAGVSAGSESMFVKPGGANVYIAPLSGFKYTVNASYAVLSTDVSTAFDVIILGET